MFEEYESILTADEVCEALKIGKNRIYTLLNQRKIKGYREGNTWRVTRQALIEYVLKESQIDSQP